MNVNMELILACVNIMGEGMFGVFAVILVIWGAVALLNKVTGRKPQ